MRKRIMFAWLIVFPLCAYTLPERGVELPSLEILNKGELVLTGDKLDLKPWSTDRLKGQWTLLQYMAARPAASKLNRHVLDAVSAEQSKGSNVRILNIINVADVPFGATGFALQAMEKNKRKFPEATIIADMNTGRSLWELASHGSTIFLLDEQNRVAFVHEGKVDELALEQLLATLPGY